MTLRKPTERQALFIRYYLNEAKYNGTQAAIMAGYNKAGARVRACRLKQKPWIAYRIQIALEIEYHNNYKYCKQTWLGGKG